MRCVNCYNTIGDDVDFCPSCNFPIFRPKSASEPRTEEAAAPEDQLEPGVASDQSLAAEPSAPKLAPSITRPALALKSKPAGSAQKRSKPTQRRGRAGERPGQKALKVGVGIVGGLAVAGLLFYALKSSGFIRSELDSRAGLDAIASVRNLQSNQTGVSIDQAMTKMLNGARESGNLVAFQGWIVRPINGDSRRVRVLFSYDEKQGRRQAEWLVSLSDYTIAPQNELAAAVSKK